MPKETGLPSLSFKVKHDTTKSKRRELTSSSSSRL